MLVRLSTLVGVLALVVAACDRPANSSGPETFAFVPTAPTTGILNAQIQPPTLPVIPTPIFGCPVSAPLSTRFNLVIGAPVNAVFLDELGLQFFDINGFAGTTVLFSSADLTGLFGTTIIVPGVVRTFPVSPQFGCGMSAPATLVATFVLKEQTGASHKMELKAAFAH